MDLSEITAPLPRGVIPFSAVEDRLLDVKSRRLLPEGAKSVLMLLFPYYLGEEAYRHANVARYAVSADYHGILRNRLDRMCEALSRRFPGERFVGFADSSPIPEKYAALIAGLGVRGKNGLLIHERYGSYCFIGSIVSTADLGGTVRPVGECRGCLACARACPGGALCADGGFTPECCVAAITQKKGALGAEECALIRRVGLVWGCDRCQTVCPMNRGVPSSPMPEWAASAKPVYTKGDRLEGRAYGWRGRAVPERNWDILYGGKDE